MQEEPRGGVPFVTGIPSVYYRASIQVHVEVGLNRRTSRVLDHSVQAPPFPIEHALPDAPVRVELPGVDCVDLIWRKLTRRKAPIPALPSVGIEIEIEDVSTFLSVVTRKIAGVDRIHMQEELCSSVPFVARVPSVYYRASIQVHIEVGLNSRTSGVCNHSGQFPPFRVQHALPDAPVRVELPSVDSVDLIRRKLTRRKAPILALPSVGIEIEIEDVSTPLSAVARKVAGIYRIHMQEELCGYVHIVAGLPSVYYGAPIQVHGEVGLNSRTSRVLDHSGQAPPFRVEHSLPAAAVRADLPGVDSVDLIRRKLTRREAPAPIVPPPRNEIEIEDVSSFLSAVARRVAGVDRIHMQEELWGGVHVVAGVPSVYYRVPIHVHVEVGLNRRTSGVCNHSV